MTKMSNPYSCVNWASEIRKIMSPSQSGKISLQGPKSTENGCHAGIACHSNNSRKLKIGWSLSRSDGIKAQPYSLERQDVLSKLTSTKRVEIMLQVMNAYLTNFKPYFQTPVPYETNIKIGCTYI
jgi:hypothetical protein